MRKRNSRGREIDMRATLALIATLLAFPAAAAQDHGPWWDCVATYLSQRNVVTAHPDSPLALDTMAACRDLSLREVGEDLDAVKAVLAHFRRLNSMPDVPSAPRIRTREDLRF
jgi:hypothetical protein